MFVFQEYLAQRKIVHRELAAKKILVSQDWNLKISDFGIPTDVFEELYHENEKARLPVRWMAPEALFDGQFTIMSDMYNDNYEIR